MEKFDWRGWINLGKPALEDVIREAYDLSKPQGLGYFHAKEGPLSDEEIAVIISRESHVGAGPIVAGMDYVLGRAVKMCIRKEPDTDHLYIYSNWYDHSRYSLELLLEKFGIKPEVIDAAYAAQNEANAEYRAARMKLAILGLAWLRDKGGRATNPALDASYSQEERDNLWAASSENLVAYDDDTQEYFIPNETK